MLDSFPSDRYVFVSFRYLIDGNEAALYKVVYTNLEKEALPMNFNDAYF